MPRWIITQIGPNILVLISMLFCYIATRPNCNWLFNCQNEVEEKNRQFLRKLSFAGMLVSACAVLISLGAHLAV